MSNSSGYTGKTYSLSGNSQGSQMLLIYNYTLSLNLAFTSFSKFAATEEIKL